MWHPDDCKPGSLAYADDTIKTCLDFNTKEEGTLYGKPYCSSSTSSSDVSYCNYRVSKYISGNTCAAPIALWNCDTSNGCVFAVWNETYKDWIPWPKY